jgi:glycosyltransferase involved in cell wall biosynthesis
VVFAGKVVANKGVDILVSACTRLASEIPGLRLKLIGRSDPALMRVLREIAERAGRPDLIEDVGFVDRQNLPAALAQADLFAAPSMYEGGPGFVYLEAMACGLPVIACSGSGASEAIIPGETGILVPPNDVSALTDALRAILTDAGRRHNMSRRARDHVVNSADSAACVRRIADFYADVVRGR